MCNLYQKVPFNELIFLFLCTPASRHESWPCTQCSPPPSPSIASLNPLQYLSIYWDKGPGLSLPPTDPSTRPYPSPWSLPMTHLQIWLETSSSPPQPGYIPEPASSGFYFSPPFPSPQFSNLCSYRGFPPLSSSCPTLSPPSPWVLCQQVSPWPSIGWVYGRHWSSKY